MSLLLMLLTCHDDNPFDSFLRFFAVSRSIFKMAVSSIFGWTRRTLISRGTIL